ncbi:type II CRISPR-associated endonuclease Cas1 [Staphylococcus lutrae]|uniref:CRISPR-associated endonuclease Cas1 n=1 Tax=Staphylococcus lutrae TaxID=155085 RepID=A0AAC9WIK3_9STAP|nr:type II CRISPR-associated endonuclease Cas1 [Staphylococcus lutrae]ARJ50339.1 subtype II CRISPR-associated endonuclease Cas1 [Staphylococcus lutrae]PNZ35819.1 type II CRISPR-associated endonuclease Cas1 [Staphylococcus lutrae]
MSFRTVIVTKEAKLSLRMNQLIVNTGDLNYIPLNEILCLVIEHPNVSMTGHLINALSDRKIITILCNNRHLPNTLILPMYGHHRQVKQIKKQMNWSQERKNKLWQRLIKQKIRNQQQVLDTFFKQKNTENFDEYIEAVEPGDITNREGHAAKVYFNTVLQPGFTRGYDNAQNAALDYGYQVLLAIVARTIVSKGYLTEIGIKHKNEYNIYNLASDFMEIFRPIVDSIVLKFVKQEFGKEEKRVIIDLLNKKVKIDNKNYYFVNAVERYVDSLFLYLSTGDMEVIRIPTWTY